MFARHGLCLFYGLDFHKYLYFSSFAASLLASNRVSIHASTSARTNAIRSPNKRTIGGNKPSFEYLRMVERGQPVSFTVSGTKTKGDLIAACESVVMVLLSKEHHT